MLLNTIERLHFLSLGRGTQVVYSEVDSFQRLSFQSKQRLCFPSHKRRGKLNILDIKMYILGGQDSLVGKMFA